MPQHGVVRVRGPGMVWCRSVLALCKFQDFFSGGHEVLALLGAGWFEIAAMVCSGRAGQSCLEQFKVVDDLDRRLLRARGYGSQATLTQRTRPTQLAEDEL